VAQVTPALLGQVNVESLGRPGDALPGDVSFSVADALYLIESSYGVSDMTCIDQWLFPLFGEGELVVA
jgi:hypothetical protein